LTPFPPRTQQAGSPGGTGPTARDAQLAAHRGGSWYSDRTRLRDIPLGRGPFTAPVTALGEAQDAVPVRTPDASPVIDEHGYALGVLALPR
jgi:hypothetical protein